MKKLYKGIVHTDCICEYARGDSPIRLELLEYEIQNISDDFISYNNGYELDTNCLEIERVSTSKKWLWSLNKQSVLDWLEACRKETEKQVRLEAKKEAEKYKQRLEAIQKLTVKEMLGDWD